MSALDSTPIATEVLRFEDLPLGSRGTRRASARSVTEAGKHAAPMQSPAYRPKRASRAPERRRSLVVEAVAQTLLSAPLAATQQRRYQIASGLLVWPGLAGVGGL